MNEREQMTAGAERVLQMCRDMTDPLWPCLTESDWADEAGALAGAVLSLASALAEAERLLAISSPYRPPEKTVAGEEM